MLSAFFPPFPLQLTVCRFLCSVSTISTATDSTSCSLFCFHYLHHHRQYIMLSVLFPQFPLHRQYIMLSVLFPLFPPPQTVHHALCSVSTISTTQTAHHALCSVSTISTTQTVHHALCSVSTISTTQTAYHARVLSFPWAVPFSWARYSPPALTWPRSDRLFQAPAAAGLLSRPSLFLLEPGRRCAFFPRFLFFTKAMWTILEYFEIWPYLVQLSIFKFI